MGIPRGGSWAGPLPGPGSMPPLKGAVLGAGAELCRAGGTNMGLPGVMMGTEEAVSVAAAAGAMAGIEKTR